MEFIRKNAKKIIGIVVVLAVLVFAYWYGGDAPGTRGFIVSDESTTEATTEESATEEIGALVQNDTTEKSEVLSDDVESIEEEATEEEADSEDDEDDSTTEEATETTEDEATTEVAESEEATTEATEGETATEEAKSSKTSKSESSSKSTTEEKASSKSSSSSSSKSSSSNSSNSSKSSSGSSSKSSSSNSSNSNKSSSSSSNSNTTTTEATTTEATTTEATTEETKLTCTISISTATILDNMDLVEKNKVSYVPSDGWILKTVTVEFTEGDTVFEVLKDVCSTYNIQIEYSFTAIYGSYYIEGIGNLYEFDVGELSGWMYSVNGVFPNFGCSKYVLKDGDVICWKYTCDLGADVGNAYTY